MHDCLQKQVAFDQRILENEEEVAGINADLADLLQEMKMDTTLFACVNVGGRMRGTQPVCGQLWTQEDRQMPAICVPMEGVGNSREEGALSGIVDVLSWRQALEAIQDPNYLPPGRRVTVYPKFLDNLPLILATGEVGADPVGSRMPAHDDLHDVH
jgi:hypothetical protein